MRVGIAFFLAAWGGWIVAAAILVFGMGTIVKPYNASTSFMMLAAYPLPPAAVIGVAAGIGAWGHRTPMRAWAGPALGLAVACLLVMVLSAYLGKRLPSWVGMGVVWVILPGCAFFLARRLARRASPKGLP